MAHPKQKDPAPSVAHVIEALGGIDAVAGIVKRKPSSVRSARWKGRFPHLWAGRIADACEAQKIAWDWSLFHDASTRQGQDVNNA